MSGPTVRTGERRTGESVGPPTMEDLHRSDLDQER